MYYQRHIFTLKLLNRCSTWYLCRHKHSEIKLSSKWKSVIGLEIHAQISSESKLFSGAGTDFASPVNSNVSFFDAAIPGTLPVLNKRCVEAGVLTALALDCTISPVSMFDRKHYFYADLPAGYQITQQRSPLAKNGVLRFQVFAPGIHKAPYKKESKLKQLQLEQDSGKSIHDDAATRSLVDLNRAGIPLMELVFEPDLSDGEEAAALVKELSLILQRLGTCSCKMEEGALRVDANISVNLPGEPLGTRTEIKNIGSVRGVASAIKYEIQRQISELEAGRTIVNETRAWDAQKKATIAMRDKEVVQDYRFMPEPNLPPLHLNMGLNSDTFNRFVNVPKLQTEIPELPEQTRTSLIEKYNITPAQAIILVNEDVLSRYFKELATSNRDPKIIVNILINEFLTSVNKHKLDLRNTKVPTNYLGEIVDMQQSGEINLITARKLLDEIVSGNQSSPKGITIKNNWGQIKDPQKIKQLCEEVLSNNSNLVTKYLSGKTKIFNALLGKAADLSQQRANMAEVSKTLQLLLSERAKSNC